MHKYLNAIGFHDIASEREWYQILLESEKKFSGYDRIALDEHTDLCELRREYGNGIGISSCGFIDENDEEFRRECYFPYFSGSGVSSYADIAVEQKASSPTYIGVCEDVKLGCSIIFHIQNGMEYIKEATLGGLNKSSISITFSGLALSGKILLPVTKDAGAADKRAKDLRNRMMLMSAAKEGNPDAIESLTTRRQRTSSRALRLTTSTPMPQYQKEFAGKIFTVLSIRILCQLVLNVTSMRSLVRF